MQSLYKYFYPERPDIVADLHGLATQLGGSLKPPRLRWKYAWMKPVFGWRAAKSVQDALPQLKNSMIRTWDKAMFKLETRKAASNHTTNAVSVTKED